MNSTLLTESVAAVQAITTTDQHRSLALLFSGLSLIQAIILVVLEI